MGRYCRCFEPSFAQAIGMFRLFRPGLLCRAACAPQTGVVLLRLRHDRVSPPGWGVRAAGHCHKIGQIDLARSQSRSKGGCTMKKSVIFISSPLKTLRFPVAGLALIFFLGGPPQPASAQTAKSDDPTETRAFAPAAIEHAQKSASSKMPTEARSRRHPSFQGLTPTTTPAGRSPPSSRAAPLLRH